MGTRNRGSCEYDAQLKLSRTAIGFITEVPGTTVGFNANHIPGLIMQNLLSLNSPHYDCTKV
jgi:hypothetical protein